MDKICPLTDTTYSCRCPQWRPSDDPSKGQLSSFLLSSYVGIRSNSWINSESYWYWRPVVLETSGHLLDLPSVLLVYFQVHWDCCLIRFQSHLSSTLLLSHSGLACCVLNPHQHFSQKIQTSFSKSLHVSEVAAWSKTGISLVWVEHLSHFSAWSWNSAQTSERRSSWFWWWWCFGWWIIYFLTKQISSCNDHDNWLLHPVSSL